MIHDVITFIHYNLNDFLNEHFNVTEQIVETNTIINTEGMVP